MSQGLQGRSLVFDAGSVISLATNNLLWLLPPLKERFGGSFFITRSVEGEIVTKPMQTRKFKFEAIQIRHLIATGTLEVVDSPEIDGIASHLLELANNLFMCKGQAIHIVHSGETGSLATVIHAKASALVIDERTTRQLIEDPRQIAHRMRIKFHKPVHTSKKHENQLRYELRNVNVIRSIELVCVAYEIGLLDHYIENIGDELQGRRDLLDAVLWGMKLNGCSVSQEEIEEILRIERLSGAPDRQASVSPGSFPRQ